MDIDTHMAGKILLTGKPGSGKSTVVKVVIEKVKDTMRVGGVITPEIRLGRVRVGFKVVDIVSGKEAVFAEVNKKSRYRVGKYGVDVDAFESVALPALDFAMDNCQLIVIDEIGKMELLSKPFEEKIEKILKGSSLVLAVVHRNFLSRYEKYGEVIWVERSLVSEVAKRIIKELKSLSG